MNQIKRIVLATDFSKHADRALEAALFLAEGYRAEVHLFHAVVLHEDDPHDPAHHFPKPSELHDLLEVLADEEMGRRAGWRPSTDLIVRTEQRRGVAAAPLILDYADEVGADLLVMGTHGRRTPARFLLGSVAEEVLRSARCPVLTVRVGATDPQHPRLGRILVPIGLSEYRGRSLEMAADCARRWGAKIDLIHVVEELSYPSFYDLSLSADVTRRVMRNAEEALTARASEALDPEIAVEKHVLSASRASTRIVSYAEESGADLVVIDRHEQSFAEHLFFGSTAERVVRHSGVAVLVTEPPEASPASGSRDAS